MNVNLLSLVLVLIFVFFIVDSALAQDPGQPDTLHFKAGQPCSANKDTLFFPLGGGFARIQLDIWNDDYISGIAVPVIESIWGPPDFAYMEKENNNHSTTPLAFVGSRVYELAWDIIAVNFDVYPPTVLYGASAITAPPMPPGYGLFAKMIYTVNDTGRICVDTTVFPPAGVVTFADTMNVTYRPQIIPGCFQLAPYIPCDANGDSLVDISDVVWLVNYLFKSGPDPANWSDANCDDDMTISDAVYLINYLLRSGPLPGDPDNDGMPEC